MERGTGRRGVGGRPVLPLSDILKKTRWYRVGKASSRMIGMLCKCGGIKH